MSVSLVKTPFSIATGRARILGTADARRACDWLADTSVPTATYRQWLTWINEGSPRQDEIPIPRPAVSGEWADDFHKIAMIAHVTGWDRDAEDFGEILDAYADAYTEAAQVAAEKIIIEYAEVDAG